MANLNHADDLGSVLREIFRATPAYIFYTALREAFAARRRADATGRAAVAAR
ncbi:MAG: hypothetical protein JSR59_00340 [Proteobacteria bacterium]|nr:hypothetical protein [Pseudomonadota bacterium]